MAIIHPVRQSHSGATGGLDAHRIEPGTDVKIFNLHRRPQMIGIVRCKTFRAIEERVNTRLGQSRKTVHRLFENGFEMVEVFGQLIKAEIVWNATIAVQASGPGL